MSEVITVQDLETLKKHEIFEAEVLTGKVGGLAWGADIDYATNQATGQIQVTLPKILRDIGLKHGSGDFTTGFTVMPGQRDYAWYDPVSLNWYLWLGVIPSTGYVVAPGTDPTADVNWKPATDELLRVDLAADTGADLIGHILPGVGAVPTNVGEYLDNLWLGSIADLRAINKGKHLRVMVAGYYSPGDGGGGHYYYDHTDTVSADNGGTIIVATDGGRWKLIHHGTVWIKQFGAKGDGTGDDAVFVQNAVNWSNTQSPNIPELHFNPGNYRWGSKVTITKAVNFVGTTYTDSGSRIFIADGFNNSAFELSDRASFRDLLFIGSYNDANSNEKIFNVLGANFVSWEGCQFLNVVRGICWTGASPSFYNSIKDCEFQNAKRDFVSINNTSAPGVDLIMSNCRMLGDFFAYAMTFDNGLGSLIASNLQISCTGATPQFQTVLFGTPATYFGGAQFTNCVFEGGSATSAAVLDLIGTSGARWSGIYLSNCLLTGGDAPALSLTFVNGVYIDNCTLSSSTAAGGIVRLSAAGNANGVRIVNTSFESLSSVPVFFAAGNSVVEMDIVSPRWTGASPFIDFLSIPSTQIRLTVQGGSIGTNANPIKLADYKNTPKIINTFGDNYGPLQRAIYTGTIDGSGAVQVAHGITSGVSRVVQANGYGRGGSGEMVPLTFAFLDGNVFRFTGGAPGNKYRVTLVYTTTNDTNW